MMKKLVALMLVLALSLCAVCALAADTAFPGELPERGVSLPMTQEDLAMGLSLSYTLGEGSEGEKLPQFDIAYADLEAIQAVTEKYAGQDFSDQNVFYAALAEMLTHYYRLFDVALFETELYNAAVEAGMDYKEMLGDAVILMGENGGYTYVAIDMTEAITYDDETQRQKIVSAALRARELLENATFIDIVFPPEEQASLSGTIAPFETTDLAGNPVTNDIFAGKDLTVVNVWGTYCNPCIEEMPDLASWSAEMPENVQLIGVVCDLFSLDDADTLETANAICEATGASVYPSLVANETLMPLLQSVVGVPTTFFVDGEGKLVGDPIVGANVPGCRAFVEAYFEGK